MNERHETPAYRFGQLKRTLRRYNEGVIDAKVLAKSLQVFLEWDDRRKNPPSKPPQPTQAAIHIGREHIARLAEADGEGIFAREVRGGCWDHRRDVTKAIETAQANIDA